MPDVDDIALLREYVERNSESAFAGIVERRINLVYSVALRFTGNSEDAQDVTQAVFVILARKAAGLRPNTILTGWLYETTRFTAMNFLTRKNRRQTREQEAHSLQTSQDARLASRDSRLVTHFSGVPGRNAMILPGQNQPCRTKHRMPVLEPGTVPVRSPHSGRHAPAQSFGRMTFNRGIFQTGNAKETASGTIPPIGGRMEPVGGKTEPVVGSLPPSGGMKEPVVGKTPPVVGRMEPIGGKVLLIVGRKELIGSRIPLVVGMMPLTGNMKLLVVGVTMQVCKMG